MNKLALLALICTIAPSVATAENPWVEHFAAKHAEKQNEAMPADLPQVADAISTARHYSGLENSISHQQVVDAISDRLVAEGAGEAIKVKLNKYNTGKPILQYRSAVTFEMGGTQFNARQLTWSSVLYPYAGKQPLAPIKLEGTYDEVVEVPVLTRRIRRDEVIALSDIKWEKIENSRLRADTALQVEQIVGQAPLRTISPNRSVRMAELARPAVVKKSDQVTLQFRNAAMELKTLGEAMEDGGEGDIIRIRNKDSKQPVQARVIAAGLAEAMPLGVLAQAKGNH